MLDMINLAKQIIDKGNELNDPELVAMGMAMLEKHQHPETEEVPEYAVTATEQEEAFYRCTNCGNESPYDKPGRKKCSKCKKHTLKLVEAQPTKEGIEKLSKILNPKRAKAEDFVQQIRQPKSSRVRYDDQGNVVGLYTRTEQIEGVTNVWTDEDKDEGQDEQNERLKRLTKKTPRTRPPVKFKKVTCEVCHNTYDIHPIHVGGRAQFVCDRCVRKRTRI